MTTILLILLIILSLATGIGMLTLQVQIKDLFKKSEVAFLARNSLCREVEKLRLVADRRHNGLNRQANNRLIDCLRRDVNHILAKLEAVSKAHRHPKPPLGDSLDKPT